MQIYLSKILFNHSICSKHIFGTLTPCVFATSASATELEHFISAANQALDATAHTMIIGPNKDEDFRDILAKCVSAVKISLNNVLGKVPPDLSEYFEFMEYIGRERINHKTFSSNTLFLFNDSGVSGVNWASIEHLYVVKNWNPTGLDIATCINLITLGFFDGSGLIADQRTAISTLVKTRRKLQNLIVMNWGDDTIADSAFKDASSLIKVIIHKATITQSQAFYRCTKLTTVSMPDLITIGKLEETTYGSFYDCDALATVSFPAVQTIGQYAFSDCIALTTVSFPVAKTIGIHAFYHSAGLIFASFPVAESIGMQAFGNCYKLQTIIYPQSIIPGTNAFQNCPSTLQKLNP